MNPDQPGMSGAVPKDVERVALDPDVIREAVRDQYLKGLDEAQYALFKARGWAGSNRFVSENSLAEINQMQERLTELMGEGRGEVPTAASSSMVAGR